MLQQWQNLIKPTGGGAIPAPPVIPRIHAQVGGVATGPGAAGASGLQPIPPPPPMIKNPPNPGARPAFNPAFGQPNGAPRAGYSALTDPMFAPARSESLMQYGTRLKAFRDSETLTPSEADALVRQARARGMK